MPPSSANSGGGKSVYFWGFTTILIYHVSHVFLFHSFDDAAGCSTNTMMTDSRRGRFLGDSSASYYGNSSSSRSIHHQSLEKKLSDFIPERGFLTSEELIRERQVTCTRWNYTYVFPKAPAFIIVGTQKGGTSALSALLDHHPWMRSSWYFEPHFFDFDEVMLQYKFRLDDPEATCKLLRTYLQGYFDLKVLRKYPNLLAFEKTPSYILTPNAHKRIKATVPWAKIIVTLRNPVDRLISQHKMTVMRRWENRSFAETLAEDINVMRHEGFWLPMDDPLNTSRMGPPAPRKVRKYKTHGMLYRGMYARQLLPWLEEYELGKNLMVIRYEELKSDPHKVLNRVLEFVGAPLYDYPQDVVNKSYSPSSHRWLDSYDPDTEHTTIEYLKAFYKPHNDRLADMLGEEWRDVWD